MICQRCGHRNERIWYEPVTPPEIVSPLDGSDVPSEMPKFYKRWACDNCKRYHFSDGTLYENPYTNGEPDK